jgi:hypothetical protein
MTQKEEIKKAKRAYILKLNPNTKGTLDRYAIYLDKGNGLTILWPNRTTEEYEKEEKSNSSLGVKVKDILPYQCYWPYNNYTYPAYHFKIDGGNCSKKDELRKMLQAINPKIKVFSIKGYAPSEHLLYD